MRAIDADALETVITQLNENGWEITRNEYKLIDRVLFEMPTIEPERKKGTFVGTEYDGYADGNPVFYEWVCSECGCVFEDDEPTYKFCPNCGALMEGQDERDI